MADPFKDAKRLWAKRADTYMRAFEADRGFEEEIVRLHEQRGYSTKEIGAALGRRPSQVRAWIRKTRTTREAEREEAVR